MKKNIDKESVSHIRSCNCRRVSLLQLLEWERRDCSPQLIQLRMHGGECLKSQISVWVEENFRLGEEKKKKRRRREKSVLRRRRELRSGCVRVPVADAVPNFFESAMLEMASTVLDQQ